MEDEHLKVLKEIRFDVRFFLFMVLAIWAVGLLILVFSIAEVHAATFDIGPSYQFYQNENLESGPGLKARLSGSNFSIWGSAEISCLTSSGQQIGNAVFAGAGIGIHHTFMDVLTLSLDLGYYQPWISQGESTIEALRMKIATMPIPNVLYRHIEYNVKGGPGSSIGIRLDKRLSRLISVGVSAEYLYRRFPDRLTGYNNGFVSFPGELVADCASFGITFRWGG